MKSKQELYKNTIQVQQLTSIKQQIQQNLEQLNNALISNDLLFLQLTTLAKNDTNQKDAPIQLRNEPVNSKSVDNFGVINAIQLDLGESAKSRRVPTTNMDEEDDTEDEDDD